LPKKSIKLLQFGVKITSLGLIEPKIQQFEYCESAHFEPLLAKFSGPYFGHQLTQKSKILGFTVIHSKSQMVMSCDCVDLTWNAPYISTYTCEICFKILTAVRFGFLSHPATLERNLVETCQSVTHWYW